MSTAFSDLRPEALARHGRFVRAVARGLLAVDVDDVVQETWITAWRKGLVGKGRTRGWLQRVARNRARDLVRGDVRRFRRERAAARPEAVEGADAAHERVELQRDVAHAILALEEPYRTVVILRYYHGHQPSEIGRRLGCKPATVRTQLVRAHEILRAKLDGRYGREAWAALLAPLARKPLPPTAFPAWLAVAAAAASATGMLVWSARGHGFGPVREARVPAEVPGLATPPVPLEALVAPPTADVRVASIVEPVLAGVERDDERRDRPVRVTVHTRAELLDHTAYDDYDTATFSFEHGLRDDPDRVVTRNDWDLLYEHDVFTACTVSDDQSLIVDLGTFPLIRLPDLGLGALRATSAGSLESRSALADRGASVALGHTYFLWTRDSGTDLVTAFEVLEQESGERCLLEWYATSDGHEARSSLIDAADRPELARTLLALRTEVRGRVQRRAPSFLLQIRTGAKGGNPNRLNVAGEANAYVDRIATEPLDVVTPVDMDEDSVAWGETGFLPDDRRLVVTRVTYRGSARGDSNGPGGLRVVLAGTELVAQESTSEPIAGVWSGHVVLAPGDEHRTFLEVRNSSVAEALFEGYWEPIEEP